MCVCVCVCGEIALVLTLVRCLCLCWAHATTQGKVEYLIKWEGYPEASNTWEKQEDVFCTGEPSTHHSPR